MDPETEKQIPLEELLAGCLDGDCRILKPTGQHLNTHCRCDSEKTREVARRLRIAVIELQVTEEWLRKQNSGPAIGCAGDIAKVLLDIKASKSLFQEEGSGKP